MKHLRIIDRRHDRRIMGASGMSHNACGAPVGLQDSTRRVFVASWRADRVKWDCCEQCAQTIGLFVSNSSSNRSIWSAI